MAACEPKEAAEPTATATGAPPVATPVVAGPTASPGVTPSVVPSVVPPTSAPAVTPMPIRVDLTPAQRAAMQALSTAQQIPVAQITLVSTEAVTWRDGCLGVLRPGVMCMQGPVAGFRITLAAAGKQYEYHTNQDGTAVALFTGAELASRIAVRAADGSVQLVDTKVSLDPSNTVNCDPTCANELWTVGLDGGQPVKVADGVFLTLAVGPR